MTANVNALFTSFNSKNLSLSNRVVMAPMTRQFSPNGIPTSDVAGYYKRRAQGGTGLIITEGTTVNDKVATMDANIPQFHGEEALTGWKHVVSEVHQANGKIMPQLWHVGMARVAEKAPYPELPSAGPSGLFKPGKQGAEPMTVQHIEAVIQAFADAASDAKAIGMDGVEIHGAHGYLIDEFFWPATNERSARFGGKTLVERSRFAVEILKAARAAVGEDFTLIIRLSQWKQQEYTARLAETPEEMQCWLGALSDAGADIFHCSQRRFWEPEFEGSSLNFAGWAKKLTGKPSISVGSVGLASDFIESLAQGKSSELAAEQSLENLAKRVADGEFDLIAVGRALLQDPNWVAKLEQGRDDAFEPFDVRSMMSLS